MPPTIETTRPRTDGGPERFANGRSLRAAGCSRRSPRQGTGSSSARAATKEMKENTPKTSSAQDPTDIGDQNLNIGRKVFRLDQHMPKAQWTVEVDCQQQAAHEHAGKAIV